MTPPHAPPARLALLAIAALAALWLASAPRAQAAGRVDVAALQVALRARGVYAATIDGYRGPATRTAVRALQRRVGLPADGVVGRRTRRALGRLGHPHLGARALARGAVGWDVAAFQFRLAWHGFPAGPIDGVYGARVAAAVARYQRWRGLGVDGVAGLRTQRALRVAIPACPRRLARPTGGPLSSRFGPRANRFHGGLDLAAPYGARVGAAAAGIVVSAGWSSGGYGNLVVVAHGGGVTTWYGHLASIAVRPGWRVGVGYRLGAVGATGDATGPHLHLECRIAGALTDPLPALR